MYKCNSAAHPVASLPTLQVHRLAGVLLASLLRIIQICLVEMRLWKGVLAPRAIFFASLASLALQLAISLAPVLYLLWVESVQGLGLGLSTLSSFAQQAIGQLLTRWTAPLRLLVVSERPSGGLK